MTSHATEVPLPTGVAGAGGADGVRDPEESGQPQEAIARVADKLGVNRETLRNWVKQAEIDGGQRPGTSTADAQRIAELERENRELRRANEILKAASAFFALLPS
jgi:transposase